MANHPISLISPFQLTQASMARNSGSLAPTTPTAIPPTGRGEHSAATLSLSASNIATDVQTMQANDATSFVYGSTASNKAATASDYTTVDDATKLADKVKTDNEVTRRIAREDKNKNSKRQQAPADDEADTEEQDLTESMMEEASQEQEMSNTMMVASHGIV